MNKSSFINFTTEADSQACDRLATDLKDIYCVVRALYCSWKSQLQNSLRVYLHL